MGMAFGNKIRITLFGESHGQVWALSSKASLLEPLSIMIH